VVVIVFLVVMVALVSGLDVLFHFVVQEVLG
jgi:preprotein translocase subunit SecE